MNVVILFFLNVNVQHFGCWGRRNNIQGHPYLYKEAEVGLIYVKSYLKEPK